MKAIYLIVFAAATGLALTSCEKKVVTQLDTESTFGKANLKIIYASAYTINYSAQLSVNNVRVSNLITNATPFPGGGLNTSGSSYPWYLAVAPGATRISLTVPKANTNVDSINLFNGTVSLDFGKYYSAYLTDTAARTKLVLVNDDLTPPAVASTSRFTFLNLMPNVPSLDLYWGTTKVASDIQYMAQSPSFMLNKGDTARWYIRPAGAAPTSAAIAIYPTLTATTAATPMIVGRQRVMTVFARGYNGGTSNKAPNVSLLYNY